MARILELKKSGMDLHQIAIEMGWDYPKAISRVRSWLNKGLTRNIAEDAEALREQDCMRLDALQATIWDKATNREKPSYEAMDRVLAIIALRAKIKGYDRPKEDSRAPNIQAVQIILPYNERDSIPASAKTETLLIKSG